MHWALALIKTLFYFSEIRPLTVSVISPVNQKQDIRKMKKILILSIALAASAISTQTFAQGKMDTKMQTTMVGGAAMYPTKDIIDNAVNSKDHTTLVAAVKAAGLVETLKGAGPFTVFAPTNAAFDKLPAGTVATLLKPENKATLTKILTYHVIAGRYSSADIAAKIKAGKGNAEFKTVSGGTLWAMMNGKDLVLKDETGATSTVTIADVNQKNGVIHVINSVVMSK